MRFTRTRCARPTTVFLVLPVVLLALLTPALAMWAMPNDAPVERLITNLTAYTTEHPQDADGFYVLGRVHGLAFTMKSRTVSQWEFPRQDGKTIPNVCQDDFQSGRWRSDRDAPNEKPMTLEELITHLDGAVRAFERSLALDPKPDLTHIGLAYVLEIGAAFAEKCPTLPGAAAIRLDDTNRAEFEALITQLSDSSQTVRDSAQKRLRESLPTSAVVIHAHRAETDPNAARAIHELLAAYWRERAITEYDAAFERAISDDIKITVKPMRGLTTLVSYEAGKAYIRMMTARGPATDAEKSRLAKVKTDIETLEKKPPNGAITPIVFSVDHAATLDELLQPGGTAVFDLDGDGVAERWPWLRPDTGILVWDPGAKGQIRSGRQLFGSVTWWLFFADGYRAMDALDDNRDGELSGTELQGLAVWFDRNSNGLSDPGEVVSVGAAGIVAISVRATSTVGRCPANPTGLRMFDGRVLPTYDWVTEPTPAGGPGA